MSDKKSFYITTTLPYVNAEPHLGFALELVQADIQARYRSLMGDEVFFNTGTDEHGVKVYRKAMELGRDPKLYVDEYAAKYRDLKEKLNLYPELNFIRTTDSNHKAATQEFWRRCQQNIGPDGPDIYKKLYQIKYCVGCELEKTDSDLVDGKCPLHPNLNIELIDEENYFFRFSRYQESLIKFYNQHKDFVVPDSRFNEMKVFVKNGLNDFSISRLKEKMPWGVDVPDDSEHVMYVWFDALINYISAIGWPSDMKKFKKWWPVTQFAGKDQVRQQIAMWQAMLMSAGLDQSKQIIIHGFINSGGQKMSKSLGNVINPFDIVKDYKNYGGIDSLRYYLMRHIHPFEDSDFTIEKFKDAYNADLANGLGNLTRRILTLTRANNVKLAWHEREAFKEIVSGSDLFYQDFNNSLKNYRYDLALNRLWNPENFNDHVTAVGWLNLYIQQERPFDLIKDNQLEKAKKVLTICLQDLWDIATLLEPFIPDTSAKIKLAIKGEGEIPTLFPRKD